MPLPNPDKNWIKGVTQLKTHNKYFHVVKLVIIGHKLLKFYKDCEIFKGV